MMPILHFNSSLNTLLLHIHVYALNTKNAESLSLYFCDHPNSYGFELDDVLCEFVGLRSNRSVGPDCLSFMALDPPYIFPCGSNLRVLFEKVFVQQSVRYLWLTQYTNLETKTI